MKIKSALIVLSLALNVGFGGILLQRAIKSAKGNVCSHDEPPVAAQRPEHVVFDAAAWSHLIDGNDTAFVARLRAEGFPREIVRLLVTHRVKLRYAERIKALYASAAFPYWRSEPNSYTPLTPEARAARRQIDREIQNELNQLLGPENAQPEYVDHNLARNYGSLPSAKITQLRALNTDYNELSAQIRDSARGVMLTEDYVKLNYLEREKLKDLQQLLTPEELQQYELRSSATAIALREQLAGFEPSETEYQLLYKIQKEFDDQYGLRYLTEKQQQLRRSATPELTAKVQAALGAERFADYQVSTDPAFRRLSYFVSRLDLPQKAAMDVVRVQQASTSQAESIRNDASLSNEQRTTALSNLVQDAEKKISTTLGDEGFQSYRQQHASWLKKIKNSSQP